MSLAERQGTAEVDETPANAGVASSGLTVSTNQILELVTAAIGIDASAVSILLADPDGTLHERASSNQAVRSIAQFELLYEEGPGVEACRSGLAVHAGLMHDADTRWPYFAPYARNVGVRSVSALPMRVRTEVIGALSLFSAEPEPRSPEEQVLTQAFADIAAIGILQERALQEGHAVLTQLQGALESRIVIEQAKGMIAHSAKISVDDAFALLRAYARNHNRRLRQTACDVIDGILSTDTITSPRRARRVTATVAAPRATAGGASSRPNRGHMEYRTAFDVIARLAQAQGIVSAQAGRSLDDALQIIRERAQVEHRTVTEIADAVLDRTISFGAAAD